MKTVFLISFFLWFATSYAQTQNVQPIEGEISLGMTTPLGGFHDLNKGCGGDLGLELRYNFHGSPWDVGVLLDVTTAVYSEDIWYFYDDTGMIASWYTWNQSNRTVALIAVGDYNFRQGKRLNPFAGAGIGITSRDIVMDNIYDEGTGGGVLFMPRIGVELARHIRLTMASHITRTGYNNLSISLGIVFGGRPKE